MIHAADYQFLSDLLSKQSGLSLGTGKEYLLESRLLTLAQSWGLESIAELVDVLRRTENSTLVAAIVEAMTTHDTQFFRDKTPFDELRDRLLPALISRRQNERRLRIWCAAVSTGQELYSLAILLHEHFPEVAADWELELVGTDISLPALSRALEGVYSQLEVQRGLPIRFLLKHFEQEKSGWRPRDYLRRGVHFEALNLLHPFPESGLFDAILCRNVLSYLDDERKQDVLERLSRKLTDDGYLILGSGESILGVTDTLERKTDCQSMAYAPRCTLAVNA